jgi:plasmid stabilization system protein ParE
MTKRVRITRPAEADIRGTAGWYAGQPDVVGLGRRWKAGVRRAIASLGKNPLRGGIAHESDYFDFELREILYGLGRKKTHRILYRITPEAVEIIAVRHVAQQDFTPDDLD